MPRPDPFDFLARNGVHIRSPTATTQSSNQGLEVPPDGRTKEDVTQIIFYEVPAEGNSKNMVQKVEQALTEHGGTDTRCHYGTQIRDPSRGCCVIQSDPTGAVSATDIETFLELRPQSKHTTNAKVVPEAPFKLITTQLRPVTPSMPGDPGTSSTATPSSHSATIHLYKAPITEVALATLKFFSPESSAKFEETIGHLIVAFAKSQTLVEPREESSSGQSDRLGEPQMKGLLAAAWGRVQEREDQYVFAFGWESLQAHTSAVRSAFGSSTIMLLQQLADLDIVHIALEEVEIKRRV